MKKDESEWKCETEDKIREERVFIVPTANLSSLEFISESEDSPSQVGLSEVVTAIRELDPTFMMSSGKTDPELREVVTKIDAINQKIANFNENIDKSTTAIIEMIETLDPEDVLHPDPDEIFLAATTLDIVTEELKSYLKGNKTITELNKIITELNKIITVLSETAAALDVSGIKNRCASGWKKVNDVLPFCKSEYNWLENDERTNCPDRENHLRENHLVSLENTKDKLEDKFESFRLQQLMLIGRVDIQPFSTFSRGKRDYYGSQRGLAQARAEWVQKQLLKKFEGQIGPSHITVLSDNYRYTDPAQHHLDRSVEVHACWASKSGQTSSSADSGA